MTPKRKESSTHLYKYCFNERVESLWPPFWLEPRWRISGESKKHQRKIWSCTEYVSFTYLGIKNNARIGCISPVEKSFTYLVHNKLGDYFILCVIFTQRGCRFGHFYCSYSEKKIIERVIISYLLYYRWLRTYPKDHKSLLLSYVASGFSSHAMTYYNHDMLNMRILQ